MKTIRLVKMFLVWNLEFVEYNCCSSHSPISLSCHPARHGHTYAEGASAIPPKHCERQAGFQAAVQRGSAEW